MRKKLTEILCEVDEVAIAEAAEFIRQITITSDSAPFIEGDEATVAGATCKTERGFGFTLRCMGVRSNHTNWGNMPVFVCSTFEHHKILAVKHLDELGRVMFNELECDKCVLCASDTWGQGSVPMPGKAKIYNTKTGTVRVTAVRTNKEECAFSAESKNMAEQNCEVLVAILSAEPDRYNIKSKKLIVGQPIQAIEKSMQKMAASGEDDKLVFCVLPHSEK